MRSMSIGMEPIAVTSLNTTPQTVSEGGFAQSLQETVDMGTPPVHAEQAAQAAQTDSPMQSVQDAVTQESAQPASELQPQETTQAAQEPQQETLTDEPAVQESDSNFGFIMEFVQPEEVAEPDDQLMKELKDLLGETEEMMTAPSRMQEQLKQLIAKAFKELSDPDIQEKEFTEKVLEFLLKYIDKVYGGETEETSVFVSADDKDDTEATDVLLQAVVQMLDNIRSEDQQTETPEEAEDGEAVDRVPAASMAREFVRTSVKNLLRRPDEHRNPAFKPREELFSGEPITRQLHTAAQPETVAEAPVTEASAEVITAAASKVQAAVEILPEVQVSEAVQPVEASQTVEMLKPVEAAQPIEMAQPAEAVQPIEGVQPAEAAQPVEAAQPIQAAQPADETENNALYQAAEQAAENILAVMVQSEKPALAENSLLKKTGYIHEKSEAAMPKPADELEELTRLVKGDVRTEQPQLDLRSDKQTEVEPIKPAVKLGATGETIPFEAAIARSVPQITLTHPFEGSGAEKIVTQIASEIFNQLPEKGGTTTFVMTLNPESLGKVTVKLVEEAGKISVSVTAHSKRTAEILSERFDSLNTAMKENGTQLEKYQVVYAPEKDERPGQQNFDGSSKNPYVKQDDEEGEGDGEFAELLQQVV